MNKSNSRYIKELFIAPFGDAMPVQDHPDLIEARIKLISVKQPRRASKTQSKYGDDGALIDLAGVTSIFFHGSSTPIPTKESWQRIKKFLKDYTVVYTLCKEDKWPEWLCELTERVETDLRRPRLIYISSEMKGIGDSLAVAYGEDAPVEFHQGT